jgi:hypothetical protein
VSCLRGKAVKRPAMCERYERYIYKNILKENNAEIRLREVYCTKCDIKEYVLE